MAVLKANAFAFLVFCYVCAADPDLNWCDGSPEQCAVDADEVAHLQLAGTPAETAAGKDAGAAKDENDPSEDDPDEKDDSEENKGFNFKTALSKKWKSSKQTWEKYWSNLLASCRVKNAKPYVRFAICKKLGETVVSHGIGSVACTTSNLAALGICTTINVPNGQLLTPVCQGLLMQACTEVTAKATQEVVKQVTDGAASVNQVCKKMGFSNPCVGKGFFDWVKR